MTVPELMFECVVMLDGLPSILTGAFPQNLHHPQVSWRHGLLNLLLVFVRQLQSRKQHWERVWSGWWGHPGLWRSSTGLWFWFLPEIYCRLEEHRSWSLDGKTIISVASYSVSSVVSEKMIFSFVFQCSSVQRGRKRTCRNTRDNSDDDLAEVQENKVGDLQERGWSLRSEF